MTKFEEVQKKYDRSIMNMAVQWEYSTNSGHIDRDNYYSVGMEILWKIHKKFMDTDSSKFKNYLFKSLRNRFLAVRKERNFLIEKSVTVNIHQENSLNIFNLISSEDKNFVNDNYKEKVKLIKKKLPKKLGKIFLDIEKTKSNKSKYGLTYSLDTLSKKYKISKTMVKKHIENMQEEISFMINTESI